MAKRAQTRHSKKRARRQADDVAYLAASEQQIVYTYLRLALSIDNLQREIIVHRDDLRFLHDVFYEGNLTTSSVPGAVPG